MASWRTEVDKMEEELKAVEKQIREYKIGNDSNSTAVSSSPSSPSSASVPPPDDSKTTSSPTYPLTAAQVEERVFQPCAATLNMEVIRANAVDSTILFDLNEDNFINDLEIKNGITRKKVIKEVEKMKEEYKAQMERNSMVDSSTSSDDPFASILDPSLKSLYIRQKSLCESILLRLLQMVMDYFKLPTYTNIVKNFIKVIKTKFLDRSPSEKEFALVKEAVRNIWTERTIEGVVRKWRELQTYKHIYAVTGIMGEDGKETPILLEFEKEIVSVMHPVAIDMINEMTLKDLPFEEGAKKVEEKKGAGSTTASVINDVLSDQRKKFEEDRNKELQKKYLKIAGKVALAVARVTGAMFGIRF